MYLSILFSFFPPGMKCKLHFMHNANPPIHTNQMERILSRVTHWFLYKVRRHPDHTGRDPALGTDPAPALLLGTRDKGRSRVFLSFSCYSTWCLRQFVQEPDS